VTFKANLLSISLFGEFDNPRLGRAEFLTLVFLDVVNHGPSHPLELDSGLELGYVVHRDRRSNFNERTRLETAAHTRRTGGRDRNRTTNKHLVPDSRM